MKIFVACLFLLINIKSFSQKKEKLVYDYTINYFSDTILASSQFDKKLKLFSTGKTSKSISPLLFCSIDCLSMTDTALFRKEKKVELESGFWEENEKEPVSFILPERIKEGKIRGLLSNISKRNMTIYQSRNIGSYKLIVIELSNKGDILGENYCIVLDDRDEIFSWCSSGWVR